MVKYLKQQEVGALVIGKNERWKQSISTGQPNNHNSVEIPDGLIEMIGYKCQLERNAIVVTEETYSSKASALNCDRLPQFGDAVPKFSDRKVKRRLYETASGKSLNADINGSLNIIPKVFPKALTAEGMVSAAVARLKVLPSSRARSKQM